MKRFIILFVLLLLLFSIKSNCAITPTKVLASELLSTAQSQAKTDGHTNIYLTNIGTATTSLATGTILGTVDIGFDLSSGKATAWAYAFYDKNKDSVIIYGVLEVLSLKYAIAISAASISSFAGYVTTDSLVSGYKDSDAMMNLISANSSYQSFKSNYSKMYLKSLGLGMNKIYTNLDYNQPYWFASFYDSASTTTLSCQVQALTGNCLCAIETGVLDNKIIKTNLNIYPNPANNVINLQIPDEMAFQDATVKISSLKGKSMKEFNLSSLSQQQLLPIDISELANGVYSISIMSNNVYYTSKFVVSR